MIKSTLLRLLAIGLGWHLATAETAVAAIDPPDCTPVFLGCMSAESFSSCAEASSAMHSVCEALKPACDYNSNSCIESTEAPCSAGAPYAISCTYGGPINPGGGE